MRYPRTETKASRYEKMVADSLELDRQKYLLTEDEFIALIKVEYERIDDNIILSEPDLATLCDNPEFRLVVQANRISNNKYDVLNARPFPNMPMAIFHMGWFACKCGKYFRIFKKYTNE